MSTASAIIRSARPKHWVKNVFVFAPLVFDRQAFTPEAALAVCATFVIFCLLSSAVYLLNDIADRERDRLHPVKRNRPIASGALSVSTAGLLSAVFASGALVAAYMLSPSLAAVAVLYLLINMGYSLALKNVMILDVMLVAAGFLLRAWAGAAVLDLKMSNWLVLCTGLVALFLGFVKRRQEISSLGEAAEQRPILSEYSLGFLDQMIAVVTSSTLLAYSLYAFDHEVAAKLGTQWLGLTIPYVLYGIFRYLYLVHQQGRGENPTNLILDDKPLLLTILLWGGTVLLVLYWL